MKKRITESNRHTRSSGGAWRGIVFVLSLVLLPAACREAYTPRPYGYYRVELPEPAYAPMDDTRLPYRFDLSAHARVVPRPAGGERYWIDVAYPRLNAKIHCSYKPVQGNLRELSEDARRFVYAHSDRADAIGEQRFEHPARRVYGILYDLQGNVASPVQFVTTDSVRHFFRGALYFDNVPNKDSIAPMLDYVRRDIVRLMETFEWREQ